MGYTDPHFESSALVTIDVQNDFTLDGAPVQIPGTLAVLPKIRALLDAYRCRGLPIVHIVRLYRRDGSDAELCRRQRLVDGVEIVIPGSPGAELVDELRPPSYPGLDAERLLAGEPQALGPNEVAIYKPRWGAFYRTPLEGHLRALSVDTLIFCGCNFPNCPRTSIYEASERGFRLVLATDAISGLYDRGRDELCAIGVHPMAALAIASQVANGHGGGAIPG